MRALLAITLAACSANESVVTQAATCGPNTHEENGECIADPPSTRYTIRANTKMYADGRHDVIVFGRHPDGTVATDAIVLNTNRPNAGTFDPPTFSLDELHHKTTYSPCSAATPGCVGPLELTVALATAPTVPVAKFPVELTATPAIGTIQNCLTGGDVLYLEGTRYMRRGALTITDATFTRGGGDQRGAIAVTPANRLQGNAWTLEFSSVQLGAPLAPGVYRLAKYNPGPGFAGIRIYDAPDEGPYPHHPFSECSFTWEGEFQVHDYVFTTSLERMTVSFRQWCGNLRPENVVTGCIHVD